MKIKNISYSFVSIEHIVSAVASVTGSYSVASFHRDRRRLGIMPFSGARFRPQPYPVTAVATILASRGYESALAPLPPTDTAASRLAKLPTMAQLQREKRKGKATR